jgi:hypothetical protein
MSHLGGADVLAYRPCEADRNVLSTKPRHYSICQYTRFERRFQHNLMPQGEERYPHLALPRPAQPGTMLAVLSSPS